MNAFINYNLKNQFLFALHQLKNLEESFLVERHLPHKWSIYEHLAHLGRYQEIFLERLTVILEKDSPLLERYRAENDPYFFEWNDLSTKEIIDKAKIGRQKIIQFIAKLSQEQLQKVGIHPKLGGMNVEGWISFFLLHESHHIYVIFTLKQQFK